MCPVELCMKAEKGMTIEQELIWAWGLHILGVGAGASELPACILSCITLSGGE